MNYKLFEKVTQNNNGKITGLNINTLPEYQDDFKKLRREFNDFSKEICPKNLLIKKPKEQWQNSGSYSKYFWNQYEPISTIKEKLEGYSLWIGIDYAGVRLQCGTTQDYNGDRQKENKRIFDVINCDVNKIFNDINISKKFIKNNNLDVSYDKTAALFYQYTENDFYNDIKYFKILLEYLGKELVNYLGNNKNRNEYKSVEEEKSKMNIKNIILYGAPGVGKTHNYKNMISLIEQGKSQKEIFDSIQANELFDDEDDSFQNVKDEKRVEFITFHQSFSYEDFIEGFRPQKNGNLEIEDGVFKLISNNAVGKIRLDSNILLNRVIESERTTYTINKITDEMIYIKKENDNKLVPFPKKLIIELIENIKSNKIELDDIKNRNLDNLSLSFDKYMYGYNSILFNVCKSLINDIKYIETKNFYLVIDEINRGNISKIFGELITLIEESKRDKYEVTLPYSKQKFSIPSNLYIIGTMNTTDKSIALIDVALRRRFTFIKMKPNTKLVLKSFRPIFEELNKKITEHIGEDYQIGHSYFMNIDDSDLSFVLDYKIKPLLEEYYYGDDRINEVLDILGME